MRAGPVTGAGLRVSDFRVVQKECISTRILKRGTFPFSDELGFLPHRAQVSVATGKADAPSIVCVCNSVILGVRIVACIISRYQSCAGTH